MTDTRFPLTRFAFARIVANLAIVALPASERACIDVGFSFADLLKIRANTIKVKGQDWRFTSTVPEKKKVVPRKWRNRWYGSSPNRGYTILEVGEHDMGYGKQIAYVGDQCNDAVNEIVRAHNAAIDALTGDA